MVLAGTRGRRVAVGGTRGRRVVIAGFAALIVGMVSHTLNGTWAHDIWPHVGAFREVAEHGLDAQHGSVAGAHDDAYLNPYTVAWGLVTGGSGLDALVVLRLAAIVNLVALGSAFFALARRLSREWFAGPLLVGLTLFAWGIQPWRWAGFFNINSLGTVLPLVSTLASAIGLYSLVALLDRLRGGGRRRLTVAAVGLPLTLLMHPMTGTWVALFAAGLVLGLAPGIDRRLVGLVAATAAAGLVALAWPYFPVAELFAGSDDFDPFNKAVFELVPLRTFAAWPGLAVLGRRLWQRQRDPIAVATLLVLAAYLGAWALGRDALGRVLPGVLLGAHLALLQEIPGWLRAADRRAQRHGLAVAGVVLAVCAASMASGFARAVPRPLLPGRLAGNESLTNIAEPFGVLPGPIGRDDVLLASEDLALGATAVSGKGIANRLPQPFVDDIDARRVEEAALRALLDRPGQAVGELRRVGVQWLVLTPQDAEPWQGRPYVEEVIRTDDLVVLRLR